jgi:hypothetical protein
LTSSRYNKLLQGGYNITDDETHSISNTMLNEDVNLTKIKRDDARAHRLSTEENYRNAMGGKTINEEDGSATGGEDGNEEIGATGTEEMKFKSDTTAILQPMVDEKNPYNSIVVESSSSHL